MSERKTMFPIVLKKTFSNKTFLFKKNGQQNKRITRTIQNLVCFL